MTGVNLPASVVRRPEQPYVNVAALQRDLRDRVRGDPVDPGSRAPTHRLVELPPGADRRRRPALAPRLVAEASRCAGEHGAPVVSRGGGTSLAGQACNVAVVIDWSKYCHRVLSVDPAARTCVVEPGIVLDELSAALAGRTGSRSGPARRPTTTARSAA